jgi:hypothetical protein
LLCFSESVRRIRRNPRFSRQARSMLREDP